MVSAVHVLPFHIYHYILGHGESSLRSFLNRAVRFGDILQIFGLVYLWSLSNKREKQLLDINVDLLMWKLQLNNNMNIWNTLGLINMIGLAWRELIK